MSLGGGGGYANLTLRGIQNDIINIDNFQNNHFHSAQRKTFFDFEKVKKLPKVQAGGGGIWLEPK